MSPTEEEIISQMERLLDFKLGREKSHDDLIAWANNVISVFKLLMPTNSSQIQILERSLNNYLLGGIYNTTATSNLIATFNGFLKGTLSDFKIGFLKDLRAEIRVEVDTNFLSQANRLLNENLKDPAAMLIGAVLEDTLRQLCQKHGVSEGANIESMNAPLRTAGAYGLPVQQQVTAWAAIRNKADHGRFDEYDLGQVKLMHQGVLDFVARHLT